MAFRILIDGVDRSLQVDDVQYTGEHNERSTLSFATEPDPSWEPGLRDEVIYYEQDETTPVFGGVIFTRALQGVSDNSADAFFRCECADWNYYLDRILVDGGVLTGTITLKAAIEWVVDNFLAGHGFTLDAAQEDGPSYTVTGFAWERKAANAIFQDLTVWSGGWVRTVSPTKVIRFIQPSLASPTAPFAITAASARARVLEWTESSERYATRVEVIWGGTGTRTKTEAFEIDAQIISDGYYETEVPSIPSGGVSATINGVAATIGGSGAQLIWDWQTHRVTTGTYTPVLGHDLTITYTAQYPGTTIVNGSGSPVLALPPVVKDDIIDAPTALAFANGLLAQHNQDVREFDLEVVDEGLKPGQVLSIDFADRLSSGMTALITGVTENPAPGTLWRYQARAISGVYQGSPLDYWRGMGTGGSAAPVVSVTYTGGTNPTVGFPLTRTDDTNVTLTLGGGHAAAVLAETSLTLGWTGQLAVSRGGTGLSSLTANRIPYGNGTSALQSSANLTFNGSTLAITGAGTFSTSVTTPLLSASGTLSIFPSGAANVQTGSGNLTLSPAGDIVLGPAGNDILPSSGYTKNLGALTNKYLTLHAAELWVETLVAQDTMATIGGRVLVGPTTSLTADLTDSATSITVKHNQMASGDRVFMQANGKYEAMAITSGASGSGPYTYSVTRNLDGSGANDWTAGDAVFNTGTTGDGFIDLYSINGLIPGSTAGPTIVGNVRTGTTYSDIAARWAIGNLNGLYGYGTDTYGAAFGDNSNAWVKIDPTNGVRIGHNATTYVEVDASGNALFSGQVTIGTGRNMLGNSEFRRESSTAFGTSTGTATGTNGPRTGMRSGTTLVGDSTKWLFGFYNGTGSPVWAFRCNVPSGFPVAGGNCYLNCSSVAPSASSVKQVLGPAISLAAGETVEFSFYGLIDGQTVQLDAAVVFVDASNSSLGSGTVVDSEAITNGGTTTDLSTYGRAHVIATAPANTSYAVPLIQVRYAASPSVPNNAVVTRMYFGYAQAGQTQPTPWAPGGVTLIDGSMLETDMVLTNTLRGGSATDLTTGTGFFLDATGTPTFRVGDPSGNQFGFDGTDVFIGQGNVLIDSDGISIAPETGASMTFDTQRSYRFGVLNGGLGVFAREFGTGRDVVLDSHVSSATGSLNTATASLRAQFTTGGATFINVFATSLLNNIEIGNTANTAGIDLKGLPDFRGPTSVSAGAIVGYINIQVGGTNYRMPYLATS